MQLSDAMVLQQRMSHLRRHQQTPVIHYTADKLEREHTWLKTIPGIGVSGVYTGQEVVNVSTTTP